jgi:hypothetical protein
MKSLKDHDVARGRTCEGQPDRSRSTVFRNTCHTSSSCTEFKRSTTIYTYSHKVTKVHRDVGNVGGKSSSSDWAEVRTHGRSRYVEAWCLLPLLLLPMASMGRLGRPGAVSPISRPKFDRNAQELGAPLPIVILVYLTAMLCATYRRTWPDK